MQQHQHVIIEFECESLSVPLCLLSPLPFPHPQFLLLQGRRAQNLIKILIKYTSNSCIRYCKGKCLRFLHMQWEVQELNMDFLGVAKCRYKIIYWNLMG